MSKREDFSYFKLVSALGLATSNVTASTTGKDVDTQGYDSVTFHVHALKASVAGTPATSYWYVRVQHTDASALNAGPSDYADVASIDLIRELSGANLPSTGCVGINMSTYSGAAMRVGYRGNKRYVRVLLSTTGAMVASSGDFYIEAMLGHAIHWPVTVPNIETAGSPAVSVG